MFLSFFLLLVNHSENLNIFRLQVGDDEYSLLVNLKRLYELQLAICVSNERLYEDLAAILRNLKNTDDEV